jgi:hypothetical protein
MAPAKKRSIHIDLVGVDDREAALFANAVAALANSITGDRYEISSNIKVAALKEYTMFGDPDDWKRHPMICQPKKAPPGA